MKNKIILSAVLSFFIISMTWTPPAKAQMIKEAVMGLFLDAPSRADADRFYMRYHAPEVIYKSGPWLRRYVSFQSYDPPPEAVERFGAVGGRYAELWFGSVEEFNSRPSGGAFTIAPWEEDRGQSMPKGGKIGTHVPAVPTEIFYDPSPNPEKTPIIRWVTAIDYPEGVTVQEGEKWFLEVHAKEALKQPGLLKFISYRCLDEGAMRLPGMGDSPSPGGEIPKRGKDEAHSWVRVNEYWYRDLDGWREAVIESPPEYTPPPWGGEYPFVRMGSTFIGYKWNIDFLKGDYIVP